jgi:acetate kinase
MTGAISVVNGGSSSIKFSLYREAESDGLKQVYRGQVDGIGVAPTFFAKSADGKVMDEQTSSNSPEHNHENLMVHIIDWIRAHRQALGLALLALPRDLIREGVYRYGFHGLSYEYIARQMETVDSEAAKGRVAVAHLGSGASMCGMLDGKIIASSMGFTAIEGLVMGTRTGSLDPGVILYLMQSKHMDTAALEDMLYKRSGLLGISEISNDMRLLLRSDDERAREAVDVFIYRIQRELGATAAALGGLDALVFTAGIGGNSAQIRSRACAGMAWLGIQLDEDANRAGGPRISTVSVWVILTNEELMIALHTKNLLSGNGTNG